MSGNGPNGGTATAQAHPTLRTGTRWGSWLEKVPKKPSFGGGAGHLGLGRPLFPWLAPVPGGKLQCLWDRNSTPVCWGCQEGSPTYCIPSN